MGNKNSISKLKNLYLSFDYTLDPFSAKEIKLAKGNTDLPHVLEEYYKKIGRIEDEDDFAVQIRPVAEIQLKNGYLLFADEIQGICEFAIKAEEAISDDPVVYHNTDGTWAPALEQTENGDMVPQTLCAFFYSIALDEGVEELNLPENIKIVEKVLLGKLEENAITDEVIHNITSLFLSGKKIKNSKPIAKLRNVTELTFSNCQFDEDIAPVFSLPNVTILQVIGCNISSISGIEAMKTLDYLRLENCGIGDIAPLRGLPCLKHVSLNGNRIADISPLTELWALENAEAKDNRIERIPSFSAESRIHTLRLNDNRITEVVGVLAMKKLTTLWLGGNLIKDVTALAAFHPLNILEVDEGVDVPDNQR